MFDSQMKIKNARFVNMVCWWGGWWAARASTRARRAAPDGELGFGDLGANTLA